MSDTKIYNGKVYLSKADENVLIDDCVVRILKTAPSPNNPDPEPIQDPVKTKKGLFAIDLGSKKLENVKTVFLALEHPQGKTRKLAYRIDLETAKFGETHKFYLEAEKRFSQRAGFLFFITCAVALVIVAITYLNMHRISPNEKQESGISAIIDYTLSHIDTSMVLGESDLVSSLDTTLTEEVRSLNENRLIDTLQSRTVNLILKSIDEYVATNNHPLYRTSIEQARRELNFYETSWLWRSKPKIYLEIFFWALIATFLRLIVNTGYYLYIRRFLSSTIYYKASLLFMVPIIAIVISVVLSYVNVQLTLGETGFKFDFKNAETSIIIAIFIGLTPWGSWEFLEDLADRFGKTLSNITGDRQQEA
ncbi:MAG: hypothetical protein HKN53_06210 [Maribacter sp.]|nr:hypothetical protein [Maribacter sp.]